MAGAFFAGNLSDHGRRGFGNGSHLARKDRLSPAGFLKHPATNIGAIAGPAVGIRNGMVVLTDPSLLGRGSARR